MHSLQYVLEFQSDRVQWQSRGKCTPGRRPWRRINILYSDI